MFDVIRSSLGKANVFAFGIGPNVNRFLIEGMARAGNGEPFMVDSVRRWCVGVRLYGLWDGV